MSYKWLCLLPIALSSCAPLRTSPHDDKHQWELKWHEVQTSLDDLKHDINCFQTELQILDGRIKYYENALAALKQQDLEKQQAKIELIAHGLQLLERKWSSLEHIQQAEKKDLLELSSHANETTVALVQFKNRIQELEQDILTQNRRFEDLAKVKGTIDTLAKTLKGSSCKIHKVRSGETLEKIAGIYRTKVEQIKKLNDLSTDLIVIGQELKIPTD